MTLCFLVANAQENIYNTFKDTRVINSHSVETLKKRSLDIRITHRFGDLFGANGGWPTFYGLEVAEDVMIGAEYGATDDLSIGLFRSAGAGSLKQLISPSVKYRILQQNTDNIPLSLTVVGIGSLSTMAKNENAQGLNRFPKFAHRIVYTVQALAARKFGERFSLQTGLSFNHRNLVESFDDNDIFSLTLASRVQMTKVIAIIADLNLPLNGIRGVGAENSENIPNYQPAFGIGFEFDTGGHVFQLNITNATGILENDFIPYTDSVWADGGFRIGFTISRAFNL
ncbi:MAG: DUF5777 family beta-barrel protein [Saprospiraceae bacterium]